MLDPPENLRKPCMKGSLVSMVTVNALLWKLSLI